MVLPLSLVFKEVFNEKKEGLHRSLYSAIVILFLAGSLAADERTDKVDKLFAEWDTTVTPGCALAVVKDGQIIYERGYGMAKIEDELAMTPDQDL